MIEVQIHSRSSWGARPAEAARLARQVPHEIEEVFIHHSDSPGHGVHTFAQAAAIARGLQAFHMNAPPAGRGWADLAYHYLVIPAPAPGLAWVLEGRPLDVVPAAQLGHNTNTCAICIVQADPESVSHETLWRTGRLARRIVSARYLRGHYEVTGTSCPGTEIRPHLDSLARIAGKRRHP